MRAQLTSASAHIQLNLVNSAGNSVTEAVVAINDVLDMMRFAISGTRKIEEQIWMDVLAAENGIVTLVEKLINAQYEDLMKTGGLTALTSYLNLGGVQVTFNDSPLSPGVRNLASQIPDFVKVNLNPAFSKQI